MTEIEKEISIHAPAAKISTYLAEPSHYPEFWNSMLELEGLDRAPDGSHYHKTRYVYKMAGIRLEGVADTLEFVPNRSLVTKSSGGIENTIRWTLEPRGEATQVSIGIQYHMPVPVLGKFAEQVIARVNEREVETLLENLKARMEG